MKISRRGLRPALAAAHRLARWLLRPLNAGLCRLRRGVKHPDSVLHISYMVHIPWHTTRILRRHGWKADFLAVGASPTWDRSDFVKPGSWWLAMPLREFMLFWRVVAKYEVVHLHFMMTMSESGWELEYLKRMGRKIVVHYRGCEIRDRERNMALHPEINICQRCDYDATICRHPVNRMRRELARRYADHVLVTTPDLKDFVPEAEHFPFFSPEAGPPTVEDPPAGERRAGRFRIVHVTNHPGIEGTDEIRAAIERLKEKGHEIDFVFLRGVPHERVIDAHRGADLAIGKMKMGYYANAQIESMAMGVPTITYVRPEFVTQAMQDSGLILTTLPELERTLEHYLSHPEALAARRRAARAALPGLHDNDRLAERLIALYARLRDGAESRGRQPSTAGDAR
jgi:glycosyltransferase involved in cell wall biosynthesis